MPSKFLTPPLGIWGLTNTGVGEQLLLQGFNGDTTSLTLKVGDIVVQDRTGPGIPALVNGQGGATG